MDGADALNPRICGTNAGTISQEPPTSLQVYSLQNPAQVLQRCVNTPKALSQQRQQVTDLSTSLPSEYRGVRASRRIVSTRCDGAEQLIRVCERGHGEISPEQQQVSVCTTG